MEEENRFEKIARLSGKATSKGSMPSLGVDLISVESCPNRLVEFPAGLLLRSQKRTHEIALRQGCRRIAEGVLKALVRARVAEPA